MTHFSHTHPIQQQASDATWGQHHHSQSQLQPHQQTFATPSWQAPPQWQQSATQQQWATGPAHPSAPAQAVVAPHFCAPVPTTFYVKDKLLSWSGGDVAILDQHGQPAFLVSGKVMSLRGSRVLKDAAGNPVCAMKEKIMSLQRKWVICQGANVSDNAVVASVTREICSMRGGVQVKLAGNSNAQYSCCQQGIIAGRREVDIMHDGQIIGHKRHGCTHHLSISYPYQDPSEQLCLVSRQRTASAIWLDQQSYQVTFNPGYDHAFLLCVVIIMDAYLHQDRGTST